MRRLPGKCLRWMMAAAAAAAAVAFYAGGPAAARARSSAPAPAPSPPEESLRSELLFDVVFERGPATSVGSPGGNRVAVPVSTGTFEGPKLKGTVVAPSGDLITVRQDGSSVLDLRLLLQTDDGQKILLTPIPRLTLLLPR